MDETRPEAAVREGLLTGTICGMSPLEVYDHFMTEFPTVYLEDHAWVNVHDGVATKLGVLSGILAAHIRGDRAVVIVHSTPGIGAELAREDVCAFVAPHVLKAEIQVADASLTSFVAILTNGVAAGWN